VVTAGGWPSAVVVHAGGRDQYQVALALHEANLLERLVTDFYAPDTKLGPFSARDTEIFARRLGRRYSEALPGRKVYWSKKRLFSLLAALYRQSSVNVADREYQLSMDAYRIAREGDTALFAYSYYAAAAFAQTSPPIRYRFDFQVHPHPTVVRRLLSEEAIRFSEARQEILAEPDLAMSDDDARTLSDAPLKANGWVAASSFTAQTLADVGIPRTKIHVVPYGVSTDAFPAKQSRDAAADPLHVVFVGSPGQRKGLYDLLTALGTLREKRLRLTVCGRGDVGESLLARIRQVNGELVQGLDHAALVGLLHTADVMVLPSIVEGFAHVVLEAMSCGVPVISTPNTCGPDVIREATDGFIVPIRSPEAIADRLSWCLENRRELAEMGRQSAWQARQFTWPRFRQGIRDAYSEMVASVES